MSTPNFWTQREYPLYVHEDIYWQDEDDPDADPVYDDDEMAFLYEEVTAALEDINEKFHFHKIVLKSGYYSGLQFYVEDTVEPEDFAWNLETWEPEDWHWEYGMGRGKVKRLYRAEPKRICHELKKFAAAWGFEELYCLGVFSNGEAVYQWANSR